MLRLLELAGVTCVRAGEGATLVSEQHRFQHVLGNGGAIDCDEGLAGTRRTAMDEARQHFLAGTGFAGDQYRAVAGSDATGQRGQTSRGQCAGDEVGAEVIRLETGGWSNDGVP